MTQKDLHVRLPKGAIKLIAKIFPDAVFYKPTNEKVIALTIDDCPSPNDLEDKSTRSILDALSRQGNVKATFFLITNHIAANSSIIKEIVDRGHEIGNHGTQDLRAANLNPSQFKEHFQQADRTLVRLSDRQPQWYRPGQGFYNRAMVEFLEKQWQYRPKMALASHIPLDVYPFLDSPQFTTSYLANYIFQGSILVLHGGTLQRAKNTATVLDKIMPQIRNLGYQIVTLSQLFELA